MDEHPIEDFLNATASSGDLWRSVDVRVLATRIEGDWHNIVTRCYLDPRPPDLVTRFPALPVTKLLGCWQKVRPVSDLAPLVHSVATGELRLGDESVKYWHILSKSGRDPYNFDSSFSDISEPYSHAYGYWSCHQLTAMGHTVHDITRRAGGRVALDNDARTSPVPFDGITGLARFAVGSPIDLEVNRACLFQTFAPLQALFVGEECRFQKGRLRYSIVAGSEAAARSTKFAISAVGTDPVPVST